MDDAPPHMPLRFLRVPAALGGNGEFAESGELQSDHRTPVGSGDAVAIHPTADGCEGNLVAASPKFLVKGGSASSSNDVSVGSHKPMITTKRDIINHKMELDPSAALQQSVAMTERTKVAELGARIARAREAKGLSQTAFGKRINQSQSAVSFWEKGDREPGRDIVARIAAELGVSERWLELGEGDDFETDDSVTSETVPVVGYVSAGAELALFDQGQGPFDYVLPPRDSKPSTVAARVQGTSLGPLFDEALIFYDSVQSPITPALHGKLCVAGLSDGRVVVKQIMPGDGGRYHLLSNSAEPPIFNAEVQWAARVTDVRPR